jgi:hypothetical protein
MDDHNESQDTRCVLYRSILLFAVHLADYNRFVIVLMMFLGADLLAASPSYLVLHASDGSSVTNAVSSYVEQIPDLSGHGNHLWAQSTPGNTDYGTSHRRQTSERDGDFSQTHTGGTGTMAAKVDLQRNQFCWQADILFSTAEDNSGIAAGNQYIFSSRSDQNSEGIGLYANADGSLSANHYGPTLITTAAGLIADNVWVHIAVCFEDAVDDGLTPPRHQPNDVDADRQILAGNLKIYVDGVLQANGYARHVLNDDAFGPVLGQRLHDLGISPRLGFDNIVIAGGNAMGKRRSTAFTDQTAELMPTLANNTTSWGDINGDGLPDLFDVATTWLNDGNGGFVVSKTGLGGANIFGDFNNDGKLDAFNYSVLRALRNDDGVQFTALPLDAARPLASIGACWADFNGDGYIDVYAGGTMANSIVNPDAIFMNHGGESFKVAWKQTAGIRNTRGVTACDFDMDNDMDVYASNYWLAPNYLWLNDGNATFSDVAAARGVQGDSAPKPPAIQTYGHTISSAWGDFDNDGYFDLFQCNFNHHDGRRGQDATFYRNRGPDHGFTFELKKILDGADWQEAFASAILGDYDNDGRLDVYICTAPGYPGSSGRLFRNTTSTGSGQASNWNFVNVTEREGLSGLQQTYQTGWGDFDLDGDLDLVTAGKFFVNNGNRNHWLEIKLTGNGKSVNRSAIGTKVRIVMGDGTTQIRQVEAGAGQASQNDMTLHFGMGKRTKAVTIEILWTDGSTQKIPDIALDQVLAVTQVGR